LAGNGRSAASPPSRRCRSPACRPCRSCPPGARAGRDRPHARRGRVL